MRPRCHTMRSFGPNAIASRTVAARTATRSARSPGATATLSKRISCAELALTASQASPGERCDVITIRPAVSNGHARPTGLNGSCRLSAPAATFTPADRSAATAVSPAGHRRPAPSLEEQVRVRERHDVDAGLRDQFGDLVLAVRLLHAEADAVAGGDRLFEAVQHHRGEVDQAEHAGIERLVGVQVDADAAIGRDLQEEVGRLGGSPVDLEVWTASDEIRAASSASRSSARWSAASGPMTGQPHRATISRSMTSATRRRTSVSASMLRRPCSVVVSAWLRTAGSRSRPSSVPRARLARPFRRRRAGGDSPASP